MSKQNSQAALAGAKARIVTLERSNANLTEALEGCSAALSGAEISIEQMVSTHRGVVDALNGRVEKLATTNAALISQRDTHYEEYRKQVQLSHDLRKGKVEEARKRGEAEKRVGKYKRMARTQFCGMLIMGVIALIISISAGIN